MKYIVPDGARPAARVVLIDERDRVLYLRTRESSGREFWVLPGGGVDQGESFEEAAVRELLEEVGAEIALGPPVWTRHHVFSWEGRTNSQFELFFVSRVSTVDLAPLRPDDYIVGHRWWTLEELRTSRETFAPRRIAALLPAILAGRYPEKPLDCGV